MTLDIIKLILQYLLPFLKKDISIATYTEDKGDVAFIVIKVSNLSNSKFIQITSPQLIIMGNNIKFSDDCVEDAIEIKSPMAPGASAEIRIPRKDFEDILSIDFWKNNKTWYFCTIRIELRCREGKRYCSRNELYCSEVGEFLTYTWKQIFKSWKNSAVPIRRELALSAL